MTEYSRDELVSMFRIASLRDDLHNAENPSRDLDHRIAVDMGWSVQPYRVLVTKQSGAVHMGLDWYDPEGKLSSPPPAFTGSADAAMKYLPSGWTAQMSQDDAGGWFVELRRGYKTSCSAIIFSRSRYPRHPTLPLAICSAAARARRFEADE